MPPAAARTHPASLAPAPPASAAATPAPAPAPARDRPLLEATQSFPCHRHTADRTPRCADRRAPPRPLTRPLLLRQRQRRRRRFDPLHLQHPARSARVRKEPTTLRTLRAM